MGSAAAVTNGVCMAVKPDPPKATQIIAATTIAPIMIVPTVFRDDGTCDSSRGA
jgi:hypothetical protein